MKVLLHVALAIVLLVLPSVAVHRWVHAAGVRLAANTAARAQSTAPHVAVAEAADEGYCSADLKRVLRRVLQSCGLAGAGAGRGCQPVQARNVATMSGDDFNALFLPLSGRAGIIEFDRDSQQLDDADRALVSRIFADQRGASYFFVVARASPEGTVDHNRELSRRRAEAVLSYLRSTFTDPDLDREVGLLWLGAEFAQLDPQFCSWQRSAPGGRCGTQEINRSAFIAWIDCRL